LIRAIYKIDVNFSDAFQVGESLIGGYFFVLFLSIFFSFWKLRQALPIFISFCVVVFSFIVPWFFAPSGHFATTHRYLIISAMGVGMFWSSLVSLFKKTKLYYTFLLIVFIFFYFQIQATHLFFSQLVASRGDKISDSIWTQLKKDLPDIKSGPHPLVF